MINWSQISRITDFCLSRLSTQSVIDAKAEAIKESGKSWFATFEERNLSDPECHYESILCKYAYPLFADALENVASEHEKLIRSTPAMLVGKLKFIRQIKRDQYEARYPTVQCGKVLIWYDNKYTFIGVPIEGGYLNIYSMEAEVW